MSEPVREQIPAALDGERVDRVVSLARRVQPERGRGARSRRRGQHRRGSGLRGHASGWWQGSPWPSTLRRASRRVPTATGPERPGGRGPRGRRRARGRQAAGLVVHPGAGQEDGHAGQRAAGPLPRAGRGGRAAPARHRAPPRPGHLRPAGGGPTPAAYTALVAALGGPPGRRGATTALVWGVPEAPRGVVDAPIGRSPRQPTRHGGGGRRPGGPHPLRGAGPLRPAGGPGPAGLPSWRPAGPTRSACTWPRSATPSSATGTTAGVRAAIAAPRHVPPRRAPRLRPPRHRTGAGLRRSAAARPGRRPRRPRRPCFVAVRAS